MPVQRIKEFLDASKVEYATITHSRVFTAQETAHSAHISGKEVAKTVLVKADDKILMVVLPANHKLDMDLMCKALGADFVRLASEDEFRGLFPECEVGAMPPFGNLYGVDVYADSSLAEDHEIFFNAGTHTELIGLKYSDFERLAHPKMIC